jgi:hypothetical protein
MAKYVEDYKELLGNGSDGAVPWRLVRDSSHVLCVPVLYNKNEGTCEMLEDCQARVS